MSPFKKFLLRVVIFPFRPLAYFLQLISPLMKAAALAGKSYNLRSKGDYEGSIKLSQEIIWMSCRPTFRLTDDFSIWSAYENIFYCYWALTNYTEAVVYGLKAMNVYFKIFGEEREFEDKTGNHYVEFTKGLKDIVDYVNEKMNPEDQRKLNLLIEKMERYKLRKLEMALKS